MQFLLTHFDTQQKKNETLITAQDRTKLETFTGEKLFADNLITARAGKKIPLNSQTR